MGWHFAHISTVIFSFVERVSKVFPQAHRTWAFFISG
jgi:hypothetical protein